MEKQFDDVLTVNPWQWFFSDKFTHFITHWLNHWFDVRLRTLSKSCSTKLINNIYLILSLFIYLFSERMYMIPDFKSVLSIPFWIDRYVMW